MSDKDPFAEPDDTDKTVIKPNPGGRRSNTPPAEPMAPSPTPQPFGEPAAPAEQAPAVDAFGVPQAARPRAAATPAQGNAEAASISMTGMNQLTACASTLFSLISRIRNRAQHMDPDKLRQSVVAEVREFENRALQAGIAAQTVKVARYALCATLDDVVLNTPWGGQSSWGLQSMVGTFHRETVGGDRFYDLLASLGRATSSLMLPLLFRLVQRFDPVVCAGQGRRKTPRQTRRVGIPDETRPGVGTGS